LLIGFQILNLSIDAAEFEPLPSQEYTIGDFNYMNSMTEYVSEVLMGKTDAFPEYGKTTTSSQSQLVKHVSLKLFHSCPSITTSDLSVIQAGFAFPINEAYACAYAREITPPPPKA